MPESCFLSKFAGWLHVIDVMLLLKRQRWSCHIYQNFMRQNVSFEIRRLLPSDLADILVLQKQCMDVMPAPELYYPLTEEELEESFEYDIPLGVFVGDELAAVAVIVKNRGGDRSIALAAGCAAEETFTFDAVIVSPKWRGYGLQKILINQCIELAGKEGIRNIVATVSPENSHSLNNFLKSGFKIVSTSEKYGGLQRHILKFDTENKS